MVLLHSISVHISLYDFPSAGNKQVFTSMQYQEEVRLYGSMARPSKRIEYGERWKAFGADPGGTAATTVYIVRLWQTLALPGR
jgi:hypothetical protein